MYKHKSIRPFSLFLVITTIIYYANFIKAAPQAPPQPPRSQVTQQQHPQTQQPQQQTTQHAQTSPPQQPTSKAPQPPQQTSKAPQPQQTTTTAVSVQQRSKPNPPTNACITPICFPLECSEGYTLVEDPSGCTCPKCECKPVTCPNIMCNGRLVQPKCGCSYCEQVILVEELEINPDDFYFRFNY